MSSATERNIVEATIRTFVRFGPKKTAISDIAEEAGVSRKTIYDRFGGKAELSVAVIRHISEQNVQMVERRIEKCRTLQEQLDTYLEETALKSFKLVQKSAEPEALISGFSSDAKQAIADSRARHSALVAKLLAPYERQILANGETTSGLAMFLVKASMAFKYSCTDEKEMKGLLKTLATTVLRMTA